MSEKRIEITAFPFHFTRLPSQEALIRYLYSVERLRDAGMPVATATTVGVHGATSGVIDVLADSNVRHLMVAAGENRGVPLEPRPSAFWWESASGQRLLVWNGLPLDFGRTLGIGDNAEAAQKTISEYCADLESREYPYDFVVFPVTSGKPGVNTSVDFGLSEFVKDWNESASDDMPKIEFVRPTDVFTHLEATFGDSIRTVRGEWPDWWSDGIASSAYETTVARQALAAAMEAERVATCAHFIDGSTVPAEEFREAYWYLSLYDEHTWGPQGSVSQPYAASTQAQWNAKAGFVHRAAALADNLLTSAFARVTDQIRAEDDAVVVFNPTPWKRSAFIHLPKQKLDTSRGIQDPETGVAAPKWITDQGYTLFVVSWVNPMSFVATDLPPLGYKVFKWTDTSAFPESVLKTEGTTLFNRFYELEVDGATGIISRWYDKRLNRDLLDDRNPYGLAQYIYERIDGQGRDALGVSSRSNPSFVRTSPTVARVRSGRQSPLAASLVSEFLADGTRKVTQEVTLYEHQPWVDIEVTVHKHAVQEPESAYLAFPFFVPNSTTRVATAAGLTEVDHGLIQDTCRDWITTQGWVDFSNDSFGVTIANPDAPLAQFGRINTGRWQTRFNPRSSTLFSWILNNYWDSNYRASQDGEIKFRYRMQSHEGEFDPAAAWRFGEETALRPTVAEVKQNHKGSQLESVKSFLSVEPDHVIVTAVKRAEDAKGYIVRLREVSGRPTVVRLELSRGNKANVATALEMNRESVPMIDGVAIRYIDANELLTLRITE